MSDNYIKDFRAEMIFNMFVAGLILVLLELILINSPGFMDFLLYAGGMYAGWLSITSIRKDRALNKELRQMVGE